VNHIKDLKMSVWHTISEVKGDDEW